MIPAVNFESVIFLSFRSAFSQVTFYKRNRREKYDHWRSFAHPEGMLYHKTAEEGISFTSDVDIYHENCDARDIEYHNEKVREVLDQLKDKLFRLEREYDDIPERKNLEIIFDTVDYNTWEYYIVDHANQHILWLERFQWYTLVQGGSQSLPHLRVY